MHNNKCIFINETFQHLCQGLKVNIRIFQTMWLKWLMTGCFLCVHWNKFIIWIGMGGSGYSINSASDGLLVIWGGGLMQVNLEMHSISDFTALLHCYHHTLLLVLLFKCCHGETCVCPWLVIHCVCNSLVVWFPLCCKGPKSPALPRPDAAGEWHKAWRSLT